MAAGRETAPLAPMLAQQIRAELLRLARDPAFSTVSLALPVIFFTFFGLPDVHQTIAGTNAGGYLLASFGAYGVVNVMLFSFGASVAVERGQRMTTLMRATPLNPLVYLLAKVVAAMLFALLVLLVLFAFGRVAGGIQLSAGVWFRLTWRLLAGALPFIVFGFAIGYLTGPNSVIAVINLIYLPLSFASGIFEPLQYMPSFVRTVAPYLPTYNYAQLAWSAVGANTGDLSKNVLWLLGYTVVFTIVASRAYWREDGKLFS